MADILNSDGDVKSHKNSMDSRHRTYLTSCLYLVGFLDLFGVSMLVPLLSHHARELGASPLLIGSISSVYGFLQLMSGPFVGRLSDTMGRRQVLLVCLFMSTFGYTLNVFSTSVFLLICSRVPLGIFKHGIATVKAYLAEITPKQERPLVFGRFNAISGVGFIIGPLCGGYLSEYEGGFYRVATFTAIIFMVNFVFAYLMVHPKTSSSPPDRNPTLSPRDDLGADFLHSFREVFQSSWDMLLLQFLLGTAAMMHRSNFTLIMAERFQTTPLINGWLISYNALVSVVSGVFVGRVVARYGSVGRLLLHCSVVLAIALLGMAFSPSLNVLIVFMTLLGLVNPLSRVCITDLSIRRGKLDNTGALLGIGQSVMSMARSFAPVVSGAMLEFGGPNAPGLAGVLCALAGTAVIVVLPPDRVLVTDADKKME